MKNNFYIVESWNGKNLIEKTAVPALFNMLNVRRAIIPGAITDIAQLVLLHATMQLLLTEAWSHHLITDTFPIFLQTLPPKSRKAEVEGKAGEVKEEEPEADEDGTKEEDAKEESPAGDAVAKTIVIEHCLKMNAYTPDLIAASDCMLGKIGYGTVAAHILQEIAFGKDYASDKLFPDALMILRFYVEIFKVFQIQRVSQRGSWHSNTCNNVGVWLDLICTAECSEPINGLQITL
ncbi:hypothetical protein D5086_031379 [Populus alba]|uniref:Uncharacterized protein n=1 Tax=Populus alba TaxID=43335 RepID=A0ACC4AIG3_POPAL